MGLDMQGRSTVMEESFRSTKPIAEFALNVLYRLDPGQLAKGQDHHELVDRGLVKLTERERDHEHEQWWDVRFIQTHGPEPTVRIFTGHDAEFNAIGEQLVQWIRDERVYPNDVCVLYNSKSSRERLEARVQPCLQRIGCRLEIQTGQAFTRDANTVVASTAQSYKGYEAEVVVVAGADQFLGSSREILPHSLYVAMTRARSILAVFGTRKGTANASQILDVLKRCCQVQHWIPPVRTAAGATDEREQILQRIGVEHTDWLKGVLTGSTIEQRPVPVSGNGLLADPLFWFTRNGRPYACFGNQDPGQEVRRRMEAAGVTLVQPGVGLE